jgi:hypothetical protein
MEDARAAVAAGQAATGLAGWAALGFRLGANLALRHAAATTAPSLVLVEPLLHGRDAVRDLVRRRQIREMMGGGRAATGENDVERAWAAGASVDMDGIEVGPRLAADLSAMDLAADLDRCPPRCPVLLLKVGSGTGFPAAWTPVANAVTKVSGGSARVVRERPFWGQVEYDESDIIQDHVLAFVAGLS